jgi:predicted AlkP superfamily phosphohydrolase/phosphomutase
VSPSFAIDSLRRPPAGWIVFAAAFLPGMVAGIQMAGLLFFLNPALPFAAAPLSSAILVYGTLWGALSAAALMPFIWGRVNRAGRILPWSIVIVLALCALIDWFHASHLSYYMPPGINTRLIKAAIGLSATALIGFYTVLLHSMSGRPYGVRSRTLMALLVLTSVYIMVERREAFEPLAVATPRPSRVEPAPRPTLWTVGLGGATLDAILPLAQQGRLPFFASLLEQGAYARLTSYPPRRDGALWTSLATGKLPYRHGVLDDRRFRPEFLDPDALLRLSPVGVAFTHWGMLGAPSEMVDSRSLDVLPAWEVLSRLGVRCGLVGWPLTDPVPADTAFVFSDRYFEGQFGRLSAQPKELAERGTLFRPEPEPDTLGRDALTAVELSALTQDLWRESLTRFLIDQDRNAQAYFLYLPGLERISNAHYSAFYKVQFEGQQGRRVRREAESLISYYEHLDRFLASLMAQAPEPKVLAVVSAFGFESQHAWGRLWGRMLADGAWRGTADDAPDGVLFLSARGVQPGAFVSNAELTDVLPTLLYSLGLPIARDLDGSVLTTAFTSGFLATQPLTFVPSYETLAEAEDEAPDLQAAEPPS